MPFPYRPPYMPPPPLLPADDLWETVVEITRISEYTNLLSRRRRRLEQAPGAGSGIVVETAITFLGLPGAQGPAAALQAEAAMQGLVPQLQNNLGELLPEDQFGAVAAGGFKLSSVRGHGPALPHKP
jgi:hypothetical protein